MRFEKSIEIAASQQRVWDVPSDIQAWPQRIETVDLLTPAPMGKGSRLTIVGSHRVEAVGEGRARLTLTIDMRGRMIPMIGGFYKSLTDRYMTLDAEGMKRAAETA